jgi:hypothetical protein
MGRDVMTGWGGGMATSSVKTKHLILLQEPFNLDIPYAERQRVVIVADAQVAAERKARARSAERLTESEEPAVPPIPDEEPGFGPATDVEMADDESQAAALRRQLVRGLQEINRELGNDLRHDLREARNAGADFKRKVGGQTTRWTMRRKLGALMVGQAEARILHFDQGHPLNNFLYVGHPTQPDLYFPAAEFHRRVFEHKFVEAVNLLTALGASRIEVQQEQGQVQEKERKHFVGGVGFARSRSEHSRHGAMFEAEFPGHGNPQVPEGLTWYWGEQTWQMIANARIRNGAQKTSLTVTYTTDYGIDTQVMRSAKSNGISIGGRFEEQHDTIWRLDAEFPALASGPATGAAVP